MQLVELPLSLTLRVAVQAPRKRAGGAPFGGGWRSLGLGGLAVPGTPLPEAQWLLTPDGYVLGVGAASEPQAPQVSIEAGGVLAPVVSAPWLQAPTLSWPLVHDLRRAHAEMNLALRLAQELSVLLGLWVEAEGLDPAAMSPLLAVDMAGDLKVRGEVLQALLAGFSIYEIGGAGVGAPPEDGERLLFEVEHLALNSPLLLRMRALVRFDNSIRIDTVLAALALLLQLAATPAADMATGCGRLEVQVEPCQPHSDEQRLNLSQILYRQALDDGGVRVAQQFLLAQGFDPGPLDGIAGERTQQAMHAFCQAQGRVCSDLHSLVFSESMALAMAQRFPIVEVPTG